MYTYARYGNENIVFDLSGSDDWKTNERFKQELATLSYKKQLTLPGGYFEGEKFSDHTFYTTAQSPSDIPAMIISDLDIDETQVLIVTNNADHVKDYVYQQFSVIYLTNTTTGLELDFAFMPDEIWTEADLYEYIKNPNIRITYASEGIGFPSEYNWRLKIFRLLPRQIPDSDDIAHLVFTGRYFKMRDNRHYNSTLSRGILWWKNNQRSGEAAQEKLGKLIGMYLRQDSSVTQITFVPPRPGKTSRFQNIDNYFKTKVPVDLNMLRVNENYESPKESVSFTEKYKLVKNKIVADKTVFGHILLIDDVYTSGATTLECARILYKKGAKKVTILPLAFTQDYDYKNQTIMPAILNEDANEYQIYFNPDRAYEAYWGSRDKTGKLNSVNYQTIDKQYLAYHGQFSEKRPAPVNHTSMTHIRAFIFDLDNTLLKTDHLESYRDAGKAVPSAHLPKAEDVIISADMLREIKNAGIQIGIVTRSRRVYAESLLKAQGYLYDSLVTYGDTRLTKPFPDPLLKCAKELNVEPHKIIHIGDQMTDKTASERAGMRHVDVYNRTKDNIESELRTIVDDIFPQGQELIMDEELEF